MQVAYTIDMNIHNDNTNEFIVYDPTLSRNRSMYAANIDLALDVLFPTASNLDCISDHITTFTIPGREGTWQIVEKGWNPIDLEV